MGKISIMGAGAMGSAIIKGLINSKFNEPSDICVYDVDLNKSMSVAHAYGVGYVEVPSGLLDPNTRILLLAVKPQNIQSALEPIRSSIGNETLVISIAAGVSSKLLLSILGEDIRLIRSMPNAAAMVGQSATAVCKAGKASDEDVKIAAEFFSSIGKVVVVEEKYINAVTALSGSGPGYLFVIMEALSDAGVFTGLSRDVAKLLTIQTVLGAATMALESNMPFSSLKDQITSPAGTTISGLKLLERSGIRGIMMETVEAAKTRADEII